MVTADIDKLLEQSVTKGEIPGVVALAATKDGIIYEGAFGYQAIGSEAPMTMSSVLWIASMSKAITTTAALQLVERGKLHLHEPLGSILPELAALKVIEGFDADGLPRFREPKRPITLHHLLTHTSGLAYEFFSQPVLDYMQQEQIPTMIACRNISLKTPLVQDPGEKWEYGISLDWVGKAIEAVSGQSLNDYLREKVLFPLGMNDTGFIIPAATRPRLAAVHQREADGSLIPTDFEMPQEPEFFMGGGGLYSTGPDYIKFLQAILNGGVFNGVRILKPETVLEMSRNQIGAINVGPLKSVVPSLSNDAEFFPGMIKKWGLGFMLTTEKAFTGRSPGSMSWVGLCNSFFWIDPIKQVAGVLQTQILPFADKYAMDLFASFETSIYQLI